MLRSIMKKLGTESSIAKWVLRHGSETSSPGVNIGVAMGESGTDVAREASELVISDDNFATIVAGRVAYDNVRKVIYLLMSTGAAEVVLVSLALLAGLPLPLLAVQLWWLNLVTNGIQDIALAFEPSEGDFEFSGVWWHPDDGDNCISGTLKCSFDETKLVVCGEQNPIHDLIEMVDSCDEAASTLLGRKTQ